MARLAVLVAAVRLRLGAVVPLTQHMRRIATVAPLVAAVVLALAAPGTAQAALHGMRTPPYLAVVHSGCPGDQPDDTSPCSDLDTRTIYLPAGSVPFARQHELGHLYDIELLDDAERAAITPLLGARGPWDQGTGSDCNDHGCPSELFADAYATCRLALWPAPYGRSGRSGWTEGYGYAPASNRAQARTCTAISRASSRP